MKKTKALEKPTNDRLREQIILAKVMGNISIILGTVISLRMIFKDNINGGFIILSFFVIFSYQLLLSAKLDKVRLEIRER